MNKCLVCICRQMSFGSSCRCLMQQIIDNSIQSIKRSDIMEAVLFKKSRIAFRTKAKLALLKYPIQSNERCSNSFVLSLAEWLNNIKKLLPPTFQTVLKKRSSKNTKTDKEQTQAEDNYFEAWCDYLFSLLSGGKITSVSDEIVLIGKLDDESFKIIENLNSFEIKPYNFSLEKNMALNEAINLVRGTQKQKNVMKHKKKIGIINFSTSTLNQDKLKPRIHLEGVISGILYNPGQEWKSFRILKNDIPKVQDLSHFNTIILSGSSYSVNTMAPQMKQFQQILIQTLKINKKLKVLGICFGHQFIAHSKGIDIVTKTLNKGLQNINFSYEQQGNKIQYLNDFIKSQYRFLRLMKYHSDHVTQISQGFKKFGESNKCDIESVISNDRRVFSLQCHPEYTEQYVQTYESRLASYQNQVVSIVKKEKDDFHHKSIEIMRKTMRNFLNWNVQQW